MTTSPRPRRHINRIGGTCSKGHPLGYETVYKRRDSRGYQCAMCAGERRAEKRRKRAEPPTTKPCGRCGQTLPLAAFQTPGTKRCRRCRDAVANAKRCTAARALTAARRDEAASVVAYCRTGTARLVERGWTADRVAAELGVPARSFARWLKGPRLPQPRRVDGLAAAMAALLGREGV